MSLNKTHIELRHEGLLKQVGRRLEFRILKQVRPDQSPAKTLREIRKSEQDLTPEQVALIARWHFNLPPT